MSVTVRAGLDRCNLALEVLSTPCATEEAGEPLDWLLVRGRLGVGLGLARARVWVRARIRVGFGLGFGLGIGIGLGIGFGLILKLW